MHAGARLPRSVRRGHSSTGRWRAQASRPNRTRAPITRDDARMMVWREFSRWSANLTPVRRTGSTKGPVSITAAAGHAKTSASASSRRLPVARISGSFPPDAAASTRRRNDAASQHGTASVAVALLAVFGGWVLDADAGVVVRSSWPCHARWPGRGKRAQTHRAQMHRTHAHTHTHMHTRKNMERERREPRNSGEGLSSMAGAQ